MARVSCRARAASIVCGSCPTDDGRRNIIRSPIPSQVCVCCVIDQSLGHSVSIDPKGYATFRGKEQKEKGVSPTTFCDKLSLLLFFLTPFLRKPHANGSLPPSLQDAHIIIIQIVSRTRWFHCFFIFFRSPPPPHSIHAIRKREKKKTKRSLS